MHNTEIRIARIFNTYGPRMQPNDGRVVSNFITQALQEKPMQIYGDGTQTRSFSFVDDIVNGLRRLMNSTYSGPFNLGNPREVYSILKLAKLIQEMTKSKSIISMLPLPEDDPENRKPVIDLANKLLGWEPYIDIQSGLEMTIKHFREYQ